MSRNCIACHSRVAANYDFIGKPLAVEEYDAEARLAIAEFEIASRQFEKGNNALFALVEEHIAEGSNLAAFEILKQWLAVEVRVKNQTALTIEKLQYLLDTDGLSVEQRDAISSWVDELHRKVQPVESIEEAIATARELLQPSVNDFTYASQELHLVQTLKASAILHTVLEGELPLSAKRKATYLLATAYEVMPVRSLEVFASMYLERCIREFPGSEEAQAAYKRLRTRIELENTGSGGIYLEPETNARLEELEKLAYGAS